MSVLDIIIPVGFFIGILWFLDQKLGWFEYFLKILTEFKKAIIRWSK